MGIKSKLRTIGGGDETQELEYKSLHKNFTYPLFPLSIFILYKILFQSPLVLVCTKSNSNSPPQWIRWTNNPHLHCHPEIPTQQCNSRPWVSTACRRLMLVLAVLCIRVWLLAVSMINSNTIYRPASDKRRDSARRGLKNLYTLNMNHPDRSPTTVPLASIRACPRKTSAKTQEKERYENPVKEPTQINGWLQLNLADLSRERALHQAPSDQQILCRRGHGR